MNIQIDTSKFELIKSAVEHSDWIFSQDGNEIQIAKGFWEKFKLVFTYIIKPSIFGTLRDKAILKLFDERMHDFIWKLKKRGLLQ